MGPEKIKCVDDRDAKRSDNIFRNFVVMPCYFYWAVLRTRTNCIFRCYRIIPFNALMIFFIDFMHKSMLEKTFNLRIVINKRRGDISG